jgi:hypothetical protein
VANWPMNLYNMANFYSQRSLMGECYKIRLVKYQFY